MLSRHLRNAAQRLRLHGPLASDPAAKVLHTLLMILVVCISLYIPVVLPFAERKGAVFAVIGSLLLTLLGALGLLRFGWLVPASVVYLCGGWLVGTSAITFSDALRRPVTLFYLLLPISAAWLLGAARMLQILQATLAVSRNTESILQGYRLGLEERMRQRTEQLEEARDQALAASRAKSAFLANMGHELRSPLNAILLLCDPAGIDMDMPEEVRQNNFIIYRSASQLAKAIDAVLDSAEAEAGQMAAENAPFDLHELMRDVTERARRRIEEKGLKLIVEASGDGPRFVNADSAKLRYVLLKLMDNAIRYTERGSVTLRRRLSLTDMNDGLSLKFEIADTGIGIAPPDQVRIFEPFRRESEVSARKGAGLGLAIARQYMELMGGSIRIESAPARGTTFYVELPARHADELEARPADAGVPRVASLAPGQPPYRVLIVEGPGEERSFLHRIVEGAGFDVQVTRPGEAGIEMFRTWRPNFIWIDRPLPARDGLETIRSIRGLDGGGEVTIAGVSDFGFERELEEMLAAGFDDFVHKPLRPIEVFDCMALHLGVRYTYEALAKSVNG